MSMVNISTTRITGDVLNSAWSQSRARNAVVCCCCSSESNAEYQKMKVAKQLQQKLYQFVNKTDPQMRRRMLIGLGGIPGSGKTTTAKLAVDIANSVAKEEGFKTNPYLCLPMDGFHRYRCDLNEEEMRRRGSPNTFDVHSFVRSVRNLKLDNKDLKWPSFDHAVADPIQGAINVSYNEHKVIVIEGNYILLDVISEWQQLKDCFDERWFLNCDLDVAIDRLVKRHQKANGITEEAAKQRVAMNDKLNAFLILQSQEAFPNASDWTL